MPSGTFLGAGVKTVVLFFTKGEPTKKIWYYQFTPGRSLGKTSLLNDNDLSDFISLSSSKKITENSWLVDIKNIDETTFDLSVKNPNRKEETDQREPREILSEMKTLNKETEQILNSISKLI